MNCNCILNETLFIYDVLNNPNDIVFTKNLLDIIPEYDVSFSGLWRPIFWDKRPEDQDGIVWERIKLSNNTGDTTVPPCEDVTTPEGLGIKSFVRIYNPKLRNWNTNNFTLDIDWIVNFKECEEYSEAILGWYRYYDINRNPDKRFLRGIDLYISDGDFATVSGLPQVSDNLKKDADLIKGQLLTLGYSAPQADRQSKILASGPQIDWISLNLTNKNNTNTPYARNAYGQMIPFLSGMSLKKYSDIGKNNFITTKIDLVRKLAEKNGAKLSVPENTEASLISKFTSQTGPNVSISLAGSLYRYNKKSSSGYNLSARIGNLEFKAARTDETYTPPPYVSFQWVNGEYKKVEKPSKPHHVNNITLNNHIIGFNLSLVESGVFAPNFEQIKFHGLGGVSLVGGVSLGESCANSVSVDASGNPIYNNNVNLEGPYFLQNYQPINNNSLEQPSQPIIINITTHENSLFRLDEKISIKYLRTDNKPECEPFVSSSTCDCFPLKRLYPDASGREELSNSEHLLSTPNTSLYYVPYGTFYANLTPEKVAEYGISLPQHPSAETPFPKTHANLHPIDSSCVYSMDGCGTKTFYYDFPYPGKIQLNYQSPSGNFKMSWGDTSVENPAPRFSTTAGSICLDKTTADPSQVMVQVSVPTETPTTNWGFSISGTQDSYSAIARLIGLNLFGVKGFFHPNFGWTYNPKYFDKSPLVPFHRGLFYKKKFNSNLGGYRISMRYSEDDGPCAGGHVCNRAKFDIIVNDVYVGMANLNNAGGSEDPGPAGTYDRISTFTIPSSVQLREGNRVDILIKCAYPDGCHGGIAWVQIINNRGQTVFNECIGTEQTVTLLLAEPENNYFYNSYAMYDEEYLPGYNYMFSADGLSDIQKQIFQNAAYVGIKVPGGSSYYIAQEWNLTHYTPSESLILDQVPFEYANIDYTSGYAYNDFVYQKIGNNKIEVVSITNNDDNRPANYIDHTSYKQTPIVMYKYDDPSRVRYANIVQASGNVLTLSNNIEEGFEKGFIFKDQDIIESVLVYRPFITENDPYIDIGKWGNMSYGDAFFEASKYFKEDSLNKLRRYNNSSIRSGISKNTSLSWSSPVKFINNYNFDDNNSKRHYFPVTRLFEDWNYGGRTLHTLGYDNAYTAQTASQNGDRIIASGSIKNTVGYLYCGSYVGPLELAVKLSDNNAKKGNIKVFQNNAQIATKSIAIKQNNNVILTFNKQREQPIYLRVELEDLSGECFGLANSEPSNLFITDYKVTVNQTDIQLRNKSRLAYYAHKPPNESALKEQSFAVGFPNQQLTIDGIKASPINVKEKYLEDKTKDFSPFLDLHIFSSSNADRPIVSQSGYVFFEDFLQPKSYKYIASGMEVPYDPNKYWINLDFNKDWSILTARGILLESQKQYKVLKKLTYNCSGEADQCSSRYKKNICEIDYDLSIEEVFDTLGVSGGDIELFDVRTIKMPQDCATIDYCCDTIDDYWQKQYCLYDQDYARKNCANVWKNEEYKASCIDTVCATGNITGIIKPEAEYFVLQLKKKIKPPVLSEDGARFYFFGSSDNLNIPCTNLSFPTIGSTFLYNYECKVNNPCDYIIMPDYTINSNYVPGEMLDLSPFVINEENGIPKPIPSSVIWANEEKYRSIVPHERMINPPFYEYDPLAESRYQITHTFNIKNKKCVGAGALFSLSIDNWSCEFAIEARASGLVLTSCFEDVMLKSSNNVSTTTANGQLVEGSFTCGYTPQTYGMTSCDQAKDYIPSDTELVSCEETSDPENYSYSCQYCGPSCYTNSITYSEALPQECFCPEWLQLDPNNEGQCTGKYDNWYCDITGDCDSGHTGAAKSNPIEGVLAGSSCFPEVKGPTQEQLDAYNNYCPEIPENLWKETVSKSYSYQNITIYEEPNSQQSAALTKINVEAAAKIQAKIQDLGCTLNDCNKKCSEIPYEECRDPYGWPFDCNAKARNACYCNCSKTYQNSYYQTLASLELTVDCVDYCGESDSILTNGWYACGYGYWWGWWGGWSWDCYNTSSSWNSTPFNQEKCGPETGCGYTACSDIEKRVTPFSMVYTYDCNENGNLYLTNEEKKTLKVNSNQTIKQRYTHKQRKVTTITKTKKLDTKALHDPENGFLEKVKVYSKSFIMEYKNNKEKECSEADIEKDCCEKVDINITITAEIFQNMMNIKFSSNSVNDNICIGRYTDNLFKCPVINYTSSNPDIYICDSVTSQCTNCNVGKLL